MHSRHILIQLPVFMVLFRWDALPVLNVLMTKYVLMEDIVRPNEIKNESASVRLVSLVIYFLTSGLIINFRFKDLIVLQKGLFTRLVQFRFVIRIRAAIMEHV